MPSAKNDINHSEAEQEDTSILMKVLKCPGEKGGTAETGRKTHTQTQGPVKAGEWPELIFQWLIEVLCGWGKDKRWRGRCEDGGIASLRV